jgi:hypothetical protein
MSSPELDNLARIGKLKHEPPSEEEIAGLLSGAEERLKDAGRAELSYASRFDLAYNAAHALALAALRRAGYRSDNRYLVFQALAHTAGMAAEKWRIFAKAHERRNLAEYEGHMERDDRLLSELIAVAKDLRKALGSSRRPTAPRKRG